MLLKYDGELGSFEYNPKMFKLKYVEYQLSLVARKSWYGYGPYVIPKGLLSARYMFSGFKFPSDFKFGEEFDTSRLKSMKGMFKNAKFEKGFSFGKSLNTENCNNFDEMFYGVKFPEGFTFEEPFDFENASSMYGMFAMTEFKNDPNFREDDKNVTRVKADMERMYFCSKIPEDFQIRVMPYEGCKTNGFFEHCILPTRIEWDNKFHTDLILRRLSDIEQFPIKGKEEQPDVKE